MAVLSDSDIVSLLKEGSLRIGGFCEQNLTPNGYDVTIEEIWIPAKDSRFKEGIAEIPGQEWFVVGTKEFLELPADIVGGIWIRTTWVRKGILSSFGRIDAGFNGNLTFSAFNASAEPVAVPIGERFAQVVFEEMRSAASESYDKRSGNYQGQRGITLAPADRQRNDRSKP
ncbi:MAG: dCTP deaminase [Thermoplasmata archaeon]|nr:dCTP deaminase [Thermoplasmata archaeon]